MVGDVNMTPEMKKKLLLRKFSSIEYMEELYTYFSKAVDGLYESIEWFSNHPPDVDWQSWHIGERPEGWEKRAVPNFEGYLESISQGIEDYKKGDSNRIRGTSNCIMSLSKDMDVLGEKWWDYVDVNVARKFGVNLGKAMEIASNIWRTVGEYWRSPESVLDEEITGPIDEQELLRYLKPGEKV
jgi:hypothetical protein